jgi:phosphohistidine phosphatase
MDLIVWRHADAEDAAVDVLPGTGVNASPSPSPDADLARCLSARGIRQATRMAHWLDRKLPDNARVLVSPAMRCEQTVVPLGRKYKICPELAPWASVDDLLNLAQWPLGKCPVVLVGHQPTLGLLVNRLLGFDGAEISLRKGSLWWLRNRQRDGKTQTVVVTVQSPDLL